MKYLWVFIVAVLVASCRSKSKVVAAKQEHETEAVCPENGVCVLQSLTNKSLKVKKSDLAQTYLEIENGKNVVLKFEYSKHHDKKLMDGSYKEEVFLELPSESMESKTTHLEHEKLYFARWCYCKGQTGYYKITEGSLRLTKLSDHYFRLHLKFKMNEVPHVITEINEVFALQ